MERAYKLPESFVSKRKYVASSLYSGLAAAPGRRIVHGRCYNPCSCQSFTWRAGASVCVCVCVQVFCFTEPPCQWFTFTLKQSDHDFSHSGTCGVLCAFSIKLSFLARQKSLLVGRAFLTVLTRCQCHVQLPCISIEEWNLTCY